MKRNRFIPGFLFTILLAILLLNVSKGTSPLNEPDIPLLRIDSCGVVFNQEAIDSLSCLIEQDAKRYLRTKLDMIFDSMGGYFCDSFGTWMYFHYNSKLSCYNPTGIRLSIANKFRFNTLERPRPFPTILAFYDLNINRNTSSQDVAQVAEKYCTTKRSSDNYGKFLHLNGEFGELTLEFDVWEDKLSSLYLMWDTASKPIVHFINGEQQYNSHNNGKK